MFSSNQVAGEWSVLTLLDWWCHSHWLHAAPHEDVQLKDPKTFMLPARIVVVLLMNRRVLFRLLTCQVLDYLEGIRSQFYTVTCGNNSLTILGLMGKASIFSVSFSLAYNLRTSWKRKCKMQWYVVKPLGSVELWIPELDPSLLLS